MSELVASGARALIVEDDQALAEMFSEYLSAAGHALTTAGTLAAATAALRGTEFDVVLVDLGLPDGNGLDLLRLILDEGLMTEAIVLTGQADLRTAIQAIKLGAYDYLTKPADNEALEVAVRQAWEKVRLRRENLSLRIRLQRQEPDADGLVTEDPAMRALLSTLDRVAPSDLPVLIQGESGTGKELIARAAHRRSPRAGQAFVAINCSALPDTLLESELFGYERGAFTGALNRKPGLFEVADRGVLFLDEIGDVSPAVQAKLLRVIETHEFFRLGGTRLVRVDVRLVSATNRDLHAAVAAGRFRDDLYYRLNGVTLSVPPLRERRGDILPLAVHFLQVLGGHKTLSPGAAEVLRGYSWPGNVRELQMVMRRAAVLCRGDAIEPADLPLGPVPESKGTRELPGGLTLRALEERYIRQTLEEHGGHRGRAARALGVSVKTLYNKLGPGKPGRERS